MVEISEVVEEETLQPTTTTPDNNGAESRSTERLSDADEIEAAMSTLTRPSAQLHIQNLITKLRKEGKALQRVAASNAASNASTTQSATAEEKMDQKDESIPQAAAAAPPAAAAVPARTPAKAPLITTNKYQSFPTYYFDAGKYNSPTVSVYVPLENIGSHDKSKISCHFTSGSFDLIVNDWGEGGDKSYRLLNDNLEKDIDTSKSKMVIKPNKILLKLGKVKGEMGSYDSWQQLTAKKNKKASAKKEKENPAAGIMDMMKDMYDEGDDNMKKMIGETMYKQRMGQLNGDMGMGGMGGMGGMDDMMGGMMGGMGGMGL
mmetsp:Transcript_17730/g.31754  ORF Transcript_17730/g.31754 Transcript_17730/m.31754 type:complete len:318 (-) Transcript_17730:129-1082(-)|eukprot:CAMPEP_0196137058 /NCGR_PEP_ID=MMETSP0910-20130528/5167_1 /TAXON_ID=49265 /ORGANISM="Thalassiosira rotula, Strain GSO102" /LENGTH=317 /DNA_ID=CAMNT_0041397457 /DNA_START=60 /DNA_END=1013 /DNA_ORIENTATION=-